MTKSINWYGNEKKLKQVAAKFHSHEIAKMFGVKEKTVIDECKKLSITVKTSSEQLYAEMQKFIDSNTCVTAKKLGEQFGFSESHIHKLSSRKKINLKRYRPPSRLNLERVTELCKTMSANGIAKELKASPTTVARFLREHGLKANQNWVYDAIRKGEVPHWTQKPEHAGRVKLRTNKPSDADSKKSIASAENVIWPDSVKVQVIKRKNNDWRNVMARPPLTKYKEITWRY